MHTYVIGATGTGKSTYLKSILPDGAFCIIHKHGTLAREVADSRPCIYWRPADLNYPIGLNPLQNVPPDDRWSLPIGSARIRTLIDQSAQPSA
jgi:hypothetical protein